MPAKNKKTNANVKKNIKRKPVKKLSRPASKKTVKAKTGSRAPAKTAGKKKAVTKTLLGRSPSKKKRSNNLATKNIKKKAAIAKAVDKKSKASKTKSGMTKATKKSNSVKPTLPNKQAIKAPKKNSALAKQAEASVNTRKRIEKPHVAEMARLIKAAAKKNINQPTPQRVRRPGAGPSGFLPYEVKTDEDYMNDAQLAHFQRVLHLWKEQLYAGRDATTQQMRDETINFPDPLDRAAVEEEHTLEWRAREREHRLIAKIDQALVRIKQGDYGYCEACGAEIGVRRLEARPTATQCIDCKTIDEIRERHTGTVE